MHVTTFYSFKGGVGRTMALANVAALLATAGRRVLVVDFDLEAPGLTSYEGFRDAPGRPGVVDYIHDYLRTSDAPDVADHITAARVGDATIWLMAAGMRDDESYAAKLGGIDWKQLYDEKDGFLLLEDMRQQWQEFEQRGFDYVLIDSRTGHTDIEGICTRQLPDSVVIMFVPTPQNVDGLVPVTRAITAETAPVRRKPAALLFCPSNLPDGDDQELILADALDNARRKLGYDKPAALIHHYASFDLLLQPIYAVGRGKSRLANEYRELVAAVQTRNPEDRDGALAIIREAADLYESASRASDTKRVQELDAQINGIRAAFPRDAAISLALARLANSLVRPQEELAALDALIRSEGRASPLVAIRRASTLASLNRDEEAVSALVALLNDPSLDVSNAPSAQALLQRLAPEEWRSHLLTAVREGNPDPQVQSMFLQFTLDSVEAAEEIAQLAKAALERQPASFSLRNVTVLALIRTGRFEEAAAILRAVPGGSALEHLPDEFNLAVAEWGMTERVPIERLRRALVLAQNFVTTRDANMLQCLALCHMAVGDPFQAQEDLLAAIPLADRPGTSFSCWRYLSLPGPEMRRDLEEMLGIVRAGRVQPPPVITDGRSAKKKART